MKTYANGPYTAYCTAGKNRMYHRHVAATHAKVNIPDHAVIHHIDEDKTNNTPANLVICQDRAYHNLLHKRLRAYAATGNPNALRCKYCKEYDKPEAIRVYPSDGTGHHPICHQLKRRVR